MKRRAGLASLARAIAGCLAIAGCQDGPAPPQGFEPPEPLLVSIPSNLGRPLPSPERNPLTAPGVALGKRLFFDVRLSGDDRVACSSCHDPALAFSDGKRRSVGVSGKPLLRHTPALANLGWDTGFFWDGGSNDLESQVYGPLTSPDEMAQSPAALVAELRADPEYVAAFAKAFPDGLTMNNVARAIAQYERTLISASSRYDRFVRGEPGGELSPVEKRGLARVEKLCARCHVPNFFTDFDYHNSGLDDRYPEVDERVAWGRGRITRKAADIGKFKTPTLRNVTRTAPYMHDGRFATLDEVINHYRSGVRPSATLDPGLARDGGIPLGDGDVTAIIAFLGTLADDTGAR